MNGFSQDIISILRHCVMFHKEAKGLLVGAKTNEKTKELFKELKERGLLVSDKRERIFWDYIVIPSELLSIRVLITAITEIDTGGIVIIEVTGKDKRYEDRYKGSVGNLGVTKVFYEERSYLVIHTGDEYGH